MKFLFIVQGEGRGHLTQALTLEEHLRNAGHEVVEVLVGKSRNRELPAFFRNKIKAPLFRFESPNFLPSPANRKSNLTGSVLYNLMRLPTFLNSVRIIRRHINESGADVVVNFYELLTGLTYLFCRPKARHICIGHQYLFLHRDFVFPRVNRVQLAMLKLFTRMTAIGSDRKLALSFHRMRDDRRRHIYVVPPLLRKEVLKMPATAGNYIHGYMLNSGFARQVEQWHKARPEVELRFFWDRKNETSVRQVDPTLSFHPIDDRAFLEQMAGCRAYASTAGFESVCEAMYLGKPVMMVPAHIEQECNAFDATRCGAGITADGFSLDRLLEFSTTFRPDSRFIFWANSVSLLVQRLTSGLPEPDENGYYTARILYLYRHYMPSLYRYTQL